MKSVTKIEKPKNNSNVGERIKYIRTSALMSQDELADKVGRKRPEITMYENGDRTPDIYTLKNIAIALDVSTDYLLGINDVETNDTDFIAINKVTGLSDSAIKNLANLKNYHNGYLLPTINYLLEQEEIFPDEYYLLADTYDSENDDLQKYEGLSKALKERSAKPHTRVITAIDNYLNFKMNSEEKLYISNNFVKSENYLSLDFLDLASTKEIVATKDVVENVWLNKINTMLKVIKETKKDNN